MSTQQSGEQIHIYRPLSSRSDDWKECTVRIGSLLGFQDGQLRHMASYTLFNATKGKTGQLAVARLSLPFDDFPLASLAFIPMEHYRPRGNLKGVYEIVRIPPRCSLLLAAFPFFKLCPSGLVV